MLAVLKAQQYASVTVTEGKLAKLMVTQQSTVGTVGARSPSPAEMHSLMLSQALRYTCSPV